MLLARKPNPTHGKQLTIKTENKQLDRLLSIVSNACINYQKHIEVQLTDIIIMPLSRIPNPTNGKQLTIKTENKTNSRC